ncbi:MAG: hypothetical protein LBJ73_02075 [Rickettsiales bacterium]|nr:hypothetical protein [Rickettsiales bacterium]
MLVLAPLIVTGAADAAATARTAVANFVTPEAYQIMYPAMNNTMRTNLNPGVTPDFSPNSVSTLTRTSGSDSRRVVSRSGLARSATGGATVAPASARSIAPSSGVARAAVSNTFASNAAVASSNNTRRVVSRGNTAGGSVARSARPESGYVNRTETVTSAAVQSTGEPLSANRCMADYTACMDGYCQRQEMDYKRCYCSARLAQIDATYKPAIDDLIKQIMALKAGTSTWSQAEMNDYWNDVIGVHMGDNSWVKLEQALDINWADTESRVRGQASFVAGHDYCVQHLRGCYYMANNMRDAYRSDIARDCAVYENSLQKIKNAAESFVESYKK